MNDEAIESEIRAKGRAAPRVTPQDIEDCIVSEHYFTAADGDFGAQERAAFATGALDGEQSSATPTPLAQLTFCVLVLRNGFTVTGESACASPENFNAEIGRTIARANAVEKIWPLEGYLLKQRLFEWAARPARKWSDMFTDAVEEMRSLSGKMQQLSSDIELALLMFEEESEHQVAQIAQLKQFKALLQSF